MKQKEYKQSPRLPGDIRNGKFLKHQRFNRKKNFSGSLHRADVFFYPTGGNTLSTLTGYTVRKADV
jgi:hypothetical protein